MASFTRRDANHLAVKRALMAAGRPVKDCATYGGLGCDLMTEHVLGYLVLLEIKDGSLVPSARKLTDSEEQLRAMFPGSFRVVLSVEEALAAVGLVPVSSGPR